MIDSVRPHGLQPTRLLCPWDSLGKNTGVGCHFLLQIDAIHNIKQIDVTESDEGKILRQDDQEKSS